MSRKYFGTDGVRGLVGERPITPDFVMRLGQAAGQILMQETSSGADRPTVLIGKDTRISGYMLEAALEAGFSSAGVDVMLAGPMPTPAIAYLTRALRLQAGVVLSASHNPFYDNGIKFFSAMGDKLPDVVELKIEAQLEEPFKCVEPARLGRARRIQDAAGRYIEFCKSTFPSDLDLRGMRIVVDCAHGAAYQIAPKVLHELGAEVFSIGVEPNGFNINDNLGATQPDALRKAVLEHSADIGIALDGDGDRLIMVDHSGKVYMGDVLIYIIAAARRQRGQLAGVVGTVMSNLGFQHAIERLGVPLLRAKVGDRYVLELLHERGWQIGGENSGHIICLDCHSTGDAIISALQVLATLKQYSLSLAEACADVTLYPQKLINVSLHKNLDWETDDEVQRACAQVEHVLGNDGRILLRPSGTEPVLRIMVEGKDAAVVETQARFLADTVMEAQS